MVGVGAASRGEARSLAPTCPLLPAGRGGGGSAPGIASLPSAGLESEEAGARNSWFLGPGAKEVAAWPGLDPAMAVARPGCQRGP